MTTKRGKTKAKSGTEGKSGRLTIKKETLKDLSVRNSGKEVRGGSSKTVMQDDTRLCPAFC